MAAPVKPVPASSPGAPGTPIPTAAELEQQRIQQTNQPAVPPTEPPAAGASVVPAAPTEPTAEQKLIASQEAVLKEQQRNLAAMQQRLRGIEERQTRAETPAGPTLEEQNADFWKNPVGVIDTLIQRELKKTVEPINQRLNAGAAVTEYDRAKARLKVEYADIWDKIEPSLDQWAAGAQQNGQAINEELIGLAALTASGAYYRGQLPNVPAPTAPATPPSPPVPVVQTPPHLRPSAPVIPGHEQPNKPEVRALTENEARLARERKMTPEQYLAWIDVPPEQVVHSNLGRPTK